MKRSIIVCFIMMVTISILIAGPFGIELGWTVEDLQRNGIKVELYDQSYNITIYDVFPTLNHPDFESYFVKIDDLKGIYEISAIGKTIETSKYGTGLLNAYKEIKEQITINYKDPDEYDYLRSGSIWSEPSDWMRALEKEERTLVSYWTPNDKGKIEVIVLEAVALNTEKGYLFLSYQSNDTHEILERNKSNVSSVF